MTGDRCKRCDRPIDDHGRIYLNGSGPNTPVKTLSYICPTVDGHSPGSELFETVGGVR